MATRLENIINRKLRAGVQAAVKHHAEAYKDAVTESTVSPAWPEAAHLGRGDQTADGRRVDRSAQAEHPYQERPAGQGSSHTFIRHAVSDDGLEGRSGVTEDGMALLHLSHGVHPVSGDAFGRKGMDDTFFSEFVAIQNAFIKAAQGRA